MTGTFVAVLMISAAKEAYEDYQRHKADRVTNNRVAKVLVGGEFVDRAWSKVVSLARAMPPLPPHHMTPRYESCVALTRDYE